MKSRLLSVSLLSLSVVSLALLVGCSEAAVPAVDAAIDAPSSDMSPTDASSPDAGADAAEDATVSPDARTPDAGADAGPSVACETVGTRIPAGDGCNFCDCTETGPVCTARTCVESGMACDYRGVRHGYGERFPAIDGCNTCTCGPSGLACTRSTECESADADTSAILLGSLDEACGEVQAFNGASVLSYVRDIEAPFLYQRDRDPRHYPETRADTNVKLRVYFPEDGIIVCRIPSPGQDAIDMEVYVEVITDDGAFNEGFHAYIRKSRSIFVDNVGLLAIFPHWTDLSGDYNPSCLDPYAITLAATFEADGSTSGEIAKVCETDLTFAVGLWTTPATP